MGGEQWEAGSTGQVRQERQEGSESASHCALPWGNGHRPGWLLRTWALPGRRASECQLQAGFKIPFVSLFSFPGISIVPFLFLVFFQAMVTQCSALNASHLVPACTLAWSPRPWHSLTQAQEGQRHHQPAQGPTNIGPVPAVMLHGSTDTGHAAGAPQTTHTVGPASGVFPLDVVPTQVGCNFCIGEAEGRRGAQAEPVRGRGRRKIV